VSATTIVIGVGNPLLGDDGVGVLVARELAARRAPSWDVDVTEATAAGLALAERLSGYRRAVVIDALVAGPGEPDGLVRRLSLEDLGASRHARSTHDTDLVGALAALAAAGEAVPTTITFVGVTASRVDVFDDELSAPVAAAAAALVDALAARAASGAWEEASWA
jgi:hydrogenase maturation protease